MKVNLPVEFSREKYNLKYKIIFTKLKPSHKLFQIPI